MNKFHILVFFIIFLSNLSISQVSIHEIQYTENPGNGTYPSPLEGQYVTAGGIVTATGYNYDNYFISSSNGGAWEGIYIYDDDFAPEVGDSIVFSGEVYEYNGFTELKDLYGFQIISSSNPLPSPVQISTHTLFTEEAYESVFVEITSVNVSQTYDIWDEWQVNDGSGPCIISYAIYNLNNIGFPLIQGYPFSSIKGVVSYSWDDYRLHPRDLDDIQSEEGAYIFSVSDKTIYEINEFDYPVLLSYLGQSAADGYEFVLEYDPSIIGYTGFDQNGNLSSNGTVNDFSSLGLVHLTFSGNFSFTGIETLITLKFLPLDEGVSNLSFTSGSLNGNNISYFSSGQININTDVEPIGDTLTIIQRPLVNIPEIIVPGEEFEIVCLAPEGTVNWDAFLIHKNKTIQLSISQTTYHADLGRWFLTATAPQPEIYELYDLKVKASGSIEDITRNAVHLISQEKDDFYFVQITDTHLPTHFYYEDPQSLWDTSEVIDLREVIEDINLIHPEFVLLTGDFINEGELEDLENRRYFTIAQRLLYELEVPVYLVSGNHDIGGWNSTPAPQGSARRNWWRFFGWEWLLDPPTSELQYTQNYSLDYGNVHFVGMESYLNYDSYLYNIYGDESFIPSQLEWLENDLSNAAQNDSKVLFYHMDFADQINLAALDVDMALYGHIHSNEGNIYNQPCNLATDNVCNGDRAYRVIKVDNGNLHPQYTSYAGNYGEHLAITYNPSNIGNTDSVVGEITNLQPLEFNHARIKFNMPIGDFGYDVQNGILEQVDKSGDFAVCYVNTVIPSFGNKTVTIKVDTTINVNDYQEKPIFKLYQNYPNPFNSSTTIKYFLSEDDYVELAIFDLTGKRIKTLVNDKKQAGYHSFVWDCSYEKLSSNLSQVYICQLKTGRGFEEYIRIIFLPQ